MIDNQILLRRRPVIRLFVSSTFTDLKHERDALQRDVFPQLEQLCASRQFQFQAIDLRWGVPTEASLDHRTMRICFEELRRSQEISPQPNFLILLGDRYGWRPLPEEVSEDEFQRLEQAASSKQAREILGNWYRRDDNAIPPVYLLQSRKQKLTDGRNYTDDQVWNSAQGVLWDIINRAYPANQLAARFDDPAALDMPLPSIVRFQASATEQEIWRGALGAQNAGQHVLAFVREIENVDEFPRTVEIRDFVDVDDSGSIDAISQGALRELKQVLRGRLSAGNVFESEHARLIRSSNEKGEPGIDVTTGHLEELCASVLAALKDIINRQIDEYWNTSGSDIPPPRQLELECSEHRRFGQERAPADSFVGRERHLQAIRDYISSESHGPLVIHGASGCGKTALLARAAQDVAPELKPVVRFIGVTPLSSDIRALLASLCQELRQRHPLDHPLPNEIRELTWELQQHFNAATAQEPLILFLDALDQLADADDGRSLHWMPSDLLPSHVKLIVSCLSDRAPEEPAGQPYATLKDRRLSKENFIDLDALSEGEAEELLFQRWLPQTGRKLNSEQAESVRKRLKTDTCRQPLYLKILFEETRLWRSTDSAIWPGENVFELLGALLTRLGDPSNHGVTVACALSYIASARRGLTEMEILEALHQDPDHKKFLEQITAKTRHRLPDNPKRIPIAIWSRLRFDLSPYFAERAAPGGTVINFYHRQVTDSVRAIFLATSEKRRAFHLALGDYLSSKSVFTTREFDELPWQFAEGAAWERLYTILADGGFFQEVWELNQFDAKSYWARIEASSLLRMVEAYRKQIEHPEQESHESFTWSLGILLGDAGHSEEALGIWSALTKYFKATGDQDNHSASLGNQATILKARSDLDGAMMLFKEQERICRDLGNKEGISITLGNQALIIRDRGDLDGAMMLLKEQERVCREIGNNDGLQRSLGNQATILITRGDLDGAMKLLKEQELICRELENKLGLSISLGNLAKILKARGDLDGAAMLLEEVERICRDLGNKEGLSISLGSQALIIQDRGDLDGAMKLFKEQEHICREIGNKPVLSASLGNQALIIQDRGDLDGAMKLHKEEERICQELGNKEGLSISLGNQAKIFKARGDLDGAMMLFKEQERICREIGNKPVLSASLGNQATVLIAHGDLDGAMMLFKEQERICRELGNKDGIQRSLGNQALIIQVRGDLDGAMMLFKEQERTCRDLGNKDGQQRSLGNQALILKARGDLDGAMMLFKEQERICRELGNKDGMQRSLGNQALIIQVRGDLDGAMMLFKEQERTCRELGNKDGQQRSLGNQALILKARGDLDGAMMLFKEQERICREIGNKDALSLSLGNQALILKARGDLDGTMKLHREEECICREIGNKEGLSLSLGSQALILQDRGDLDGAIKLHEEVERICREIGEVNGLAMSLTSQSVLLANLGHTKEGLSKAEEAYQLASTHGYGALAAQIGSILNAIRQAARRN